MSIKIDYKANPFYLDDEAIKWVEDTFASMTEDEKCGQVFCPMGFSNDDNVLRGIVEGAALGLNWSFAPIVDINREFHNPITNVRTFGDDPKKIEAFASRYMDGADECGVAVSIKHSPGDGIDERDQHIVTSVNSLGVREWDESFGYIYGSLIGKGAKTVMVGHIAQPAYVGNKL